MADRLSTVFRSKRPAFPDQSWSEAYRVLFHRIADPDFLGKALAPSSYDNLSIEPYSKADACKCYRCILLHKGRTTELPIDIIFSLTNYQPVFENEVFVLFEKKSSPNDYLAEMYMSISSKIKNSTKKLGFVHIPKTAGTSVVEAIRASLLTVKYVAKREDLQEYVGYCGICGHFYLSDLLDLNKRFDIIFSVLRDPKDRLLSAVAHSRRETETVSKLGPSMKAMRKLSLMDFLDTEFAYPEINATSIYLGWKKGLNRKGLDKLRRNAVNQIADNKVLLFNSDKLEFLADYFRQELYSDWEFGKRNATQDKSRLFTNEENRFIDNEVDRFFVEERDFIKRLEEFTF